MGYTGRTSVTITPNKVRFDKGVELSRFTLDIGQAHLPVELLGEAYRSRILGKNFLHLGGGGGEGLALDGAPKCTVADPGFHTKEFSISFWLYLNKPKKGEKNPKEKEKTTTPKG